MYLSQLLRRYIDIVSTALDTKKKLSVARYAA